GKLPKTAAVVEVQRQKVAEQQRYERVGRRAQEFFNPRAIACSPGGLEPIACLVDITRDAGRLKPIISYCGRVHARLPCSERLPGYSRRRTALESSGLEPLARAEGQSRRFADKEPEFSPPSLFPTLDGFGQAYAGPSL